MFIYGNVVTDISVSNFSCLEEILHKPPLDSVVSFSVVPQYHVSKIGDLEIILKAIDGLRVPFDDHFYLFGTVFGFLTSSDPNFQQTISSFAEFFDKVHFIAVFSPQYAPQIKLYIVSDDVNPLPYICGSFKLLHDDFDFEVLNNSISILLQDHSISFEFFSTVIQPIISSDNIIQLFPFEIISSILFTLDTRSLISLSKTCKYWHFSQLLWKSIYKNLWGGSFNPNSNIIDYKTASRNLSIYDNYFYNNDLVENEENDDHYARNAMFIDSDDENEETRVDMDSLAEPEDIFICDSREIVLQLYPEESKVDVSYSPSNSSQFNIILNAIFMDVNWGLNLVCVCSQSLACLYDISDIDRGKEIGFIDTSMDLIRCVHFNHSNLYIGGENLSVYDIDTKKCKTIEWMNNDEKRKDLQLIVSSIKTSQERLIAFQRYPNFNTGRILVFSLSLLKLLFIVELCELPQKFTMKVVNFEKLVLSLSKQIQLLDLTTKQTSQFIDIPGNTIDYYEKNGWSETDVNNEVSAIGIVTKWELCVGYRHFCFLIRDFVGPTWANTMGRRLGLVWICSVYLFEIIRMIDASITRVSSLVMVNENSIYVHKPIILGKFRITPVNVECY